jgi:hypothetical protein
MYFLFFFENKQQLIALILCLFELSDTKDNWLTKLKARIYLQKQQNYILN